MRTILLTAIWTACLSAGHRPTEEINMVPGETRRIISPDRTYNLFCEDDSLPELPTLTDRACRCEYESVSRTHGYHRLRLATRLSDGTVAHTTLTIIGAKEACEALITGSYRDVCGI